MASVPPEPAEPGSTSPEHIMRDCIKPWPKVRVSRAAATRSASAYPAGRTRLPDAPDPSFPRPVSGGWSRHRGYFAWTVPGGDTATASRRRLRKRGPGRHVMLQRNVRSRAPVRSPAGSPSPGERGRHYMGRSRGRTLVDARMSGNTVCASADGRPHYRRRRGRSDMR